MRPDEFAASMHAIAGVDGKDCRHPAQHGHVFFVSLSGLFPTSCKSVGFPPLRAGVLSVSGENRSYHAHVYTQGSRRKQALKGHWILGSCPVRVSDAALIRRTVVYFQVRSVPLGLKHVNDA